MLSGEKPELIVNKSLLQKNKEAKEGQKQVNTLEVEESKFNMVQPIEKETKQTVPLKRSEPGQWELGSYCLLFCSSLTLC